MSKKRNQRLAITIRGTKKWPTVQDPEGGFRSLQKAISITQGLPGKPCADRRGENGDLVRFEVRRWGRRKLSHKRTPSSLEREDLKEDRIFSAFRQKHPLCTGAGTAEEEFIPVRRLWKPVPSTSKKEKGKSFVAETEPKRPHKP